MSAPAESRCVAHGPRRLRRHPMPDFRAAIHQSAIDKLIASASYPLTLLERSEDFPGCDQMRTSTGNAVQLSDQQIDSMFGDAGDNVATRTTLEMEEESIDDQLFEFAGDILADTRKMLDACDHAEYEGPSREELQSVLDRGVSGIRSSVSAFGDFGAYAWCSYLRVRMNRPGIDLGSPRIDIDGIDVDAKATGELWLKFPWWNCHQYCLKWKKVSKCKRAAKLTVGLGVTSDVSIELAADGANIDARGRFRRLRVDRPILREIPLEGVANKALKDKRVTVFDGSALIATVPVMKSRFVVDRIGLPVSANSLDVEVDVRQI